MSLASKQKNHHPRRQVISLLLTLVMASVALAGFSGCEDKTASTQPGKTEEASATANSTALRTVSGIQMEDVREGSGTPAQKGDTVSVNYLGTLASNGQKFDSSYDRNEPFTFELGSGQVIEGWEKGIIGMKPGGKRILTIPPDKAYGENGAPPVIPPNASLKFEVELVEIK